MKTGEKIRCLRAKQNLTAKELSKVLNISESSVSLIENGKRKPSLEIIIKVADYFKVTTDFLLGYSDSLKMENNQTDISDVMENTITLLNNCDNMLFEGKKMDQKTVMFFKNNLHCLLENMRMLSN